MRRPWLAALPLLLPAGLPAQVVNDWSDTTSAVVTSMNEGTVKEDDYAAQGIFMDWESVLSDFEGYGGSEAVESMAEDIRAEAPSSISELLLPDGTTISLPSVPDENGIDLFLLTREGIYIYLAINNPAYHYEPDDDVVKWIRYYAYERRAYTKRIFNRYAAWEPSVKRYFELSGIPPELAELCLIESGCTYGAVSPAGAAGLWQIMPATGRQFGLRIDESLDERLDPVSSTFAAARILLANHRHTGDWTLAAAAYNCGAGRVMSEVKKHGHSWEDIRTALPPETRQYIPSLLAIHYVWTYREKLAL